jgi:exosortase
VASWCLAVLALAVLALGLAWAYWPTLNTLADRWSRDPQYSHGFLVPVFALVVLWQWRGGCPVRGLRPSWGGLALLLVSAGMRLTAAYLYLEPLETFSLIPAVAGLVWAAFGWPALRWAWPAVAFLAFMLPLPFQVEGLLAQPLRKVATTASTYTLQTLGYPALSEGNHILIGDVRLGVADACSGLGMLMTFFALATAAVLILQPRWPDRVVIVASAIPIALVANVARITLAGAVHVAHGAAAGQFVHDHAGWLMMPLALALLWLELRYLGWLLPEPGPSRPLALNLQQPLSPTLPRKAPPGAPSPPRASHLDTLSETR